MCKESSDGRRLILLSTFAILAIAIVVAVGYASRVQTASTVTVGNAALRRGSVAPQFSVFTNAGPFNLAATRTPVLLEVFATWCPHCQREVAVLNRLCRKYQARVSFVGVCGSPFANPTDGTPETLEHVNAFAQALNVEYPIAFDPNLAVAQQYLEAGFPTIVVIKRDKTISYIDHGEISEAEVEQEIDAALRG